MLNSEPSRQNQAKPTRPTYLTLHKFVLKFTQGCAWNEAICHLEKGYLGASIGNFNLTDRQERQCWAELTYCKSQRRMDRSLYWDPHHIFVLPQKVQFGTLAISWKGIPNWGRSFYLTSPFRHCKSSSDNNCQVLLSLETMKRPIPGNIESKTYLDFYSFIYPVHLWTRQKRGVGEQNYDTVLSCK